VTQAKLKNATTRGCIPLNKLLKLSILDLRIWVHLGCTEQEKFNPQLVSLNIELYFKSLPEGARNDKRCYYYCDGLSSKKE
jgi:hypothetical protein